MESFAFSIAAVTAATSPVINKFPYVSLGGAHSAVIKKDGTVICSDVNEIDAGGDHGQGNVSHWTDIIAVAANDMHTVGLKSDTNLTT